MPMNHGKMPLDRARDLLKSARLRCTAARIALLRSLAESDSPNTQSQLAERLAEFGFDRSTIFRALSDLSEAGLLERLDLGDGVRRFELLSGESDDSHPHFMCTDCGQVQCLPDVTVQLKSTQRLKSPGVISQILVRGQCETCLT
jgi:Fur family ferric uptake transcriptional regulator